MQGRIVSREAWLEARREHLKNEKALTRMRDMVAAERRRLPWVRVDKEYVFDTPAGQKPLADLFGGRSQLFVQHFMLAPGSDHVCEGCSVTAEGVDAARQHFENADLSYVAVSRAPLARIEAVKRRMGWRFDWVSSAPSSFNYDFGVSFTPDQVAAGEPLYNFGTASFLLEELHGVSVFARDEAGAVFHTYSGYARAAETLIGAFSFLDFAPKGRNEQTIMDWVRLHDEYEQPKAADCCCGVRDAAE